MSGYTKKEQEEFNKFCEEKLKQMKLLYPKTKKIKKPKKKRGLKRGEWKG